LQESTGERSHASEWFTVLKQTIQKQQKVHSCQELIKDAMFNNVMVVAQAAYHPSSGRLCETLTGVV